MHQTKSFSAPIIGLLTLALPGGALAYDKKDAIRDCESRIRSEYDVSDLRDASAEKILDSEHHYKVHGLAKVDGDKHPWTCEVKNRHVTSAEYSGPKPTGMGTAEKLAIGAAAAVAAGIAISELGKQGGEGQSSPSGAGAAGLQDLVGARGSSGESQLESRGYTYVSGSKGGDSSYTNWRKGSHCVSVRTTNGHYDSIVDVGMADCEGGSHAGSGGAGAAHQTHQPDYADGLAGGPDFWEVAGVPAGDTLNLRSGPSAHDQVVGEIGNGSVMRNLGCKMAGGQRWCRVGWPKDSGSQGWVNGRYLRESSYQP